ncbi:hypothetical protein M405DRAFT_866319 [Rhizopogon salebrosus TDB-379]|nr:hypothetical protein M405DRAFT_866319 [Rhizopogon salebrosus TDB-379]
MPRPSKKVRAGVKNLGPYAIKNSQVRSSFVHKKENNINPLHIPITHPQVSSTFEPSPCILEPDLESNMVVDTPSTPEMVSTATGKDMNKDDYYLDHESDGDIGSENGADLDVEGDCGGDTEYATEPAQEFYAQHLLSPTLGAAEKALEDIKLILKPRRKSGVGFIWGDLPPLLQGRLEQMRMLLCVFIDHTNNAEAEGRPGPQWMASSLIIAKVHQKGPSYARKLRFWTRSFIMDRDNLPFDSYGISHLSKIDDDELASELYTHLQSIGKYIKAADLVSYVSNKEVQKRFGLTSGISHATAKRWMNKLGYRWLRDHRGQYVDGHERIDVIQYRQEVFIPAIMAIEPRLKKWLKDGITSESSLPPGERHVEAWFQDEVTFYANDRRHSGWKQLDASADPRPKGEGVSMMVSDFISASHGWCRSPDGKESARVVFKAGKARDGYYTCEDVSCSDI